MDGISRHIGALEQLSNQSCKHCQPASSLRNMSLNKGTAESSGEKPPALVGLMVE